MNQLILPLFCTSRAPPQRLECPPTRPEIALRESRSFFLRFRAPPNRLECPPHPARNRLARIPPFLCPARSRPAAAPQPPRSRPAAAPQQPPRSPHKHPAAVPQPSHNRPAAAPQPSHSPIAPAAPHAPQPPRSPAAVPQRPILIAEPDPRTFTRLAVTTRSPDNSQDATTAWILLTAHNLAGKLQTQRVACGRATGKCKYSSRRGWRLSFLHPAESASRSLTQAPRRPRKTHRGLTAGLRDGGLYLAGSGERQQRLEQLQDSTAARRDSHLPTFFLLRRSPFFQSALCAKVTTSTLHVACILQGLLGLAEDVEDEVPVPQSHLGARGAPKDCLRRLQAPELHLQFRLLLQGIAPAKVTFWARLGHLRHVVQVLGLGLLSQETPDELLKLVLLRLCQNVLDGLDLLLIPLVDLALDALRIRGVGLGRILQEQLQLAPARR